MKYLLLIILSLLAMNCDRDRNHRNYQTRSGNVDGVNTLDHQTEVIHHYENDRGIDATDLLLLNAMNRDNGYDDRRTVINNTTVNKTVVNKKTVKSKNKTVSLKKPKKKSEFFSRPKPRSKSSFSFSKKKRRR